MEKIISVLEGRKVNLSRANNKTRVWHAATSAQDLAAQIFEHYRRKIRYGHLLGIIRRIGVQAVYECWNNAKHSNNVRDEKALFLWNCGRHKIVWRDQKG